MLKKLLVMLLIFKIALPVYAQDSLFDNDDPPRLVPVSEALQASDVVQQRNILELYPQEQVMSSATPEEPKIINIGDHYSGTGFIINGYVVTCAHVANDMKPSDEVTFGNYKNGSLVAKNKNADLAVYEFQGVKGGYEPSTTIVKVGDTLKSIGRNNANDPTITTKTHTVKAIDKFGIFTDGATDRGRSGAPLLDSDNRVVGIFCGTRTAEPYLGLQVYTKVEYLVPMLNPVQYKITMYSGSTCKFCKQQHEITDSPNDKRIVFDWTYDKCPDWILRKLNQPYILPVGVWQCEGNKYSWPQKSGVHTIDEFVSMCEVSNAITDSVTTESVMGSPEKPVGAISIGPQVDDLFNWYRKYVPVGSIAKLKWTRSGLVNFNVYGGKKTVLSLESLLGKTGTFELGITYPDSFTGEKIPVRDLEFSYHLDGNDITFRFGDIKIYGVVSDIDNKLTFKSGEDPKGFISIMTLWTITSTIHTVYVLFHPVADIVLGTDVGLTTYMVDDDTISIDFTDMPSLKLISLMTFNLGLKQLIVTKSKVVLKFTGSRLIKQYTLDIK